MNLTNYTVYNFSESSMSRMQLVSHSLATSDIDQLVLIQPTNISSHSTCKQLHRCSVSCYRLVRKRSISL